MGWHIASGNSDRLRRRVSYWLAFSTATSPTAQLDEKKWALSGLSAGAAGLVGYLVRK
jgi:hypothetical protein